MAAKHIAGPPSVDERAVRRRRTIIIGVLLLDSQFCWRGLQSRGHVPNLFEPDQWRLRLPPTVAGRYTAQPASGSIRQWLMFDGPPSGAIRVGL